MPEDRPYVSLVVTARNDDHGGSLLSRMQAFVNGWLGQCKRHGLASELIVVDWNPPEDRPPLIYALRWPTDTSPCSVRFIQVPREVHQTYQHAEALPLYQMIAKNVGIRRARGEFVLATNIDILFSDELVSFLAEHRLESGRMYRIDRHDVMNEVPVDGAVDDQLQYCKGHLLRVNAREGTFTLTPDGRRTLDREDIADPDSGINFGSGWYGVERHSAQEAFRWVDNDAEVFVNAPSDPPPALVFDLEPGPGVKHQAFHLQVRDTLGDAVAETWVRGRSKLQLRLPAGAGEVQHFFLHVEGGGCSIPHDPRILNFRVFRCQWETLSAIPNKRVSPRTSLEMDNVGAPGPTGVSAEEIGLWSKAQRFMSSVGQEESDQPVVVTLPPEIRHFLHAYYREGGIRGVMRAYLQRYMRPPHLVAKIAAGQDITDTQTDLRLGFGWYDLEHFHGETFRWVRNGAELLVRCPQGPSQPLAIHVEPGPGVNWKPFELQLLDSTDRKVAAVRVKKLQYAEMAIPWLPDQTQVLRFHVDGGDQTAPDDPRHLNFRIFWLGWPQAISHAEEKTRSRISLDPGILLGAGWRAAGEAGNDSLEASQQAEILLQAAGPLPLVLRLELAPGSPGAFPLEVQDPVGRVVARGMLQGRQVCYLSLPVSIGSTQVYILRCPGSLRLYQAGWSDTEVDITTFAAGLITGGGWSDISCKGGELCRQVEQEAALEITVPAGPQRFLRLDLEAAESIPVAGVFLDAAEQTLAEFQIAERRTVLIAIPWRPGHRDSFRLRAPGVDIYRCEWAAAGESEETSRHFRCEGVMAEPNEDVVDPGIILGKGWFRPERGEGETFRWGSDQAEISIEGNPLHQTLSLEIEGGPSLEDDLLEIDLLDRSYRRVAAITVRGRENVQLELPYQAGWPNVFRLAVKGGGIPLVDDPRILNFRVFRVACEQAQAAIEPRWSLHVTGPRGSRSFAKKQTPGDSRTGLATFLHTNACGDFTLMAREHWFDLRGYPEFDMYSFHIDSVLCYAAHHGGIRETLLQEPMRIYHIEHGAGSGWTPEGQAKLFDRLRAKGIDWIDYQDLVIWAAHMRKLNSPMIFNRENWGLAGLDLPELLLSSESATAVVIS